MRSVRWTISAVLPHAHALSACGTTNTTTFDATVSIDAAGADSAQFDAMSGDAAYNALPSPACGSNANNSPYSVGTTVGSIAVAGAQRTFRVHVPNSVSTAPRALVLMLHGGGGSGRQLEEASSRMNPVADRENFIAVYPDGTGTIRTWNAGGCCGRAVSDAVDDVAFIGALLDHLESSLCLDRTRIFAAGMSNGAMMAHRLGCELSDRIAAIASVAGTDMTSECSPAQPISVLHIHGSADGHVPWEGGVGCGPAGVSFVSVPTTIERWRARTGVVNSASETFVAGNGRCEGARGRAEVVLCRIDGGGHNWPGGEPPAGLVECPANGTQSQTFSASEVIWRFFASHPRITP